MRVRVVTVCHAVLHEHWVVEVEDGTDPSDVTLEDIDRRVVDFLGDEIVENSEFDREIVSAEVYE